MKKTKFMFLAGRGSNTVDFFHLHAETLLTVTSTRIYNIETQEFRQGTSSGPLAPPSIQDLLQDPEVIAAIVKGLKYLGY